MHGVDRRRVPWGVFLVILLAIMIITYYACGLFKIPGITYDNFQEWLLYIIKHPVKNWWTDKTGAFMGIAFIAWIMFIAWYINYYRNTQFGKEHGTEQWANVKKLSKTLRDKDEKKNTYLSRNIAVANDRLSNMNMLVIGGSGSYKTTSVLVPNLLLAAFADKLEELGPFGGGGAGDPLVCKDARHRPVGVLHDHIGVVGLLGFVAGELFLVLGGHPAVGGYPQLALRFPLLCRLRTSWDNKDAWGGFGHDILLLSMACPFFSRSPTDPSRRMRTADAMLFNRSCGGIPLVRASLIRSVS